MDVINIDLEYFKTAQLVEMLGITRQGVSRRADVRGWESRLSSGQGGGKEFLFASLDKDTQDDVFKALINSGVIESEPKPYVCPEMQAKIDAQWKLYHTKSNKIKERAGYRTKLLQDAWKLYKQDIPLTKAFQLIAEEYGEKACNL